MLDAAYDAGVRLFDAAEGARIGASTSGPRQADAVRRVLDVLIDGEPLLTSIHRGLALTYPGQLQALAVGLLPGQLPIQLHVWVPRTVSPSLTSAIAASRPRKHGPQPEQLWPSDLCI